MSLFFPISLLLSGFMYAIWDHLPLVSKFREMLRFLIILIINTVFFFYIYSSQEFPLQSHLFLSLSGVILLLLTIIKGLKLESRIKRVKSGNLSLNTNESIETAYSNILTLGGIGLVVLMLAVITGFIIIETKLESLALKSFFSMLALLIYLGILSLIKFNNLQLKNAVRMLLLSFIMILVSYSFSNAAINLS
jgi:hypothetical protein